jgi:PKD domain
VATACCEKTLPARIASPPAARARRRAAVVLATAVWLLLALVCAAPAPAMVAEVGGRSVGMQPREAAFVWDGNIFGEGNNKWFETETSASFNNPAGHPVLHSSRVYLIYWDPADRYHGDWQGVIDSYLHDVNATSGSLNSVFAVDTQYTDSSNQPAAYNVTFRGAYSDTDPYPAAGCADPNPPGKHTVLRCLSDQQVQEEIASFIVSHGLQKGMGSIFYVLTPPGVTVCVAAGHCSDFKGTQAEESYANSFCSYHAAISPTNPVSGDGNTILYGVIPWVAGRRGNGALEIPNDSPECQDGGFNPASRPIEQLEKPKEKNEKEEEEFRKKSKEEKAQQERQEALEGPHPEEPNTGTCPSPDGYCDTGLADVIVTQIASEQQNIVTDPLLNAWQDSIHREVTDECRNFFESVLGGSAGVSIDSEAGSLFNQAPAGGMFYVNDAFNLAALKLSYPGVPCMNGVRLVPKFTTPSPVNAGDIVSLNGMESLIDLNAAVGYPPGAPSTNYASYEWNFGDGAVGDPTPVVRGYAPGAPACSIPWVSPCAASEFHAYSYGGTYNVTLTVTDVGGNKESVTLPLQVLGPPPPTAGASKAGPGATSGAGAPPSATVVVLSHSLRQVLRSGLLIAYSVSERVTGRFEVLLDKKVAHKLHLRAPAATGLAPGTPAQMVIGKSILVTLGGGHARMKIQLPGSIASSLAHTRSVALILRLVVRNATGGQATIVTPLKLSH